MKAVLVGATLAALSAIPASAQFFGPPPSYSYGAVTPFDDRGVSGTGTSGGRAAAIHACSARATRYNEYTWGDMEFQQYRACMAQHGQVE